MQLYALIRQLSPSLFAAIFRNVSEIDALANCRTL